LTLVTDVVIRPLTLDDDFDAQLDLGQRAFGVYAPGVRDGWLQRARYRAGQGLALGAFLGDEPVGAATIQDMRQYWLGNSVPTAGISGVKVAPEHRGRGIGKRLMTEVLALSAERGYLLSALYPATTPIYRSLGWELAGAKHQFTIPARSLRTLVKPDELAQGRGGSGGAAHADARVRRAAPADAQAVMRVIDESHRAARDAGAINWDEGSSAEWLGREDLYAYLTSNTGSTGDGGFAAYRWDGDDLWVERVHVRTPEALRALWSVIASHGSVAQNVSGYTAPYDPFWWLTQERDATVSRRVMWMLRVVDAPAAIAARGFPPGLTVSLPLAVSDPARPGNAGHWQLRVADGQGTLTPDDDATPAFTLGARGLAALYAGIPAASLRLSGLASGGTPDSDAQLSAAFTATPYMVDDF
jgi:predicted acetyltransferase